MEREKVELNWNSEDHKGKKKGFSELLKKITDVDLSSLLLSEEQLKIYLSSLNLPKEIAAQILKGIQKSKDDLLKKAGTEFSKLVQKIDLVKEFKKTLIDHRISIRADIEFIPKNKNKKINKKTNANDSFSEKFPSEKSLPGKPGKDS